MPTDVSKAREQATAALGNAWEQARTPFLVALGATDIATQTVTDAVNKVRIQINERADAAKSSLGELPTDLQGLRGKLDPAELRKLVDNYTKQATDFYDHLADRGEDTLGRLRSQPRVQQAINQVEAAQERVGSAVDDARELADDVLGRVTRTTRSFGERAARATETVAEQAAETIEEAGEDSAEAVKSAGTKTASTTRSTTRKAASRTAPAKSTSNSKKESSTTSTATSTSGPASTTNSHSQSSE